MPKNGVHPALPIMAGVALVLVGTGLYLSRKKSTDPLVTGYLARIAAATNRVELEAVRGLVFPYIEPITYPTSYLATGFEVDFFKGTISQSQYNTLFNAYLAKLNTLPAYVTRYDPLAAAPARQSVRRVTSPASFL